MPWRRPGLARVTLDDVQVVYDPTQHRTHRLNPTAALVLEQCDGQTSVAAFCDELAAAFGVSRTQIGGEVTAVLADFATQALVSPGRPSPSPAVVAPAGAPAPPRRTASALPRYVTGPGRALDVAFRIGTDDPALAAEVEGLFGGLTSDAPTSDVRSYELVPADRSVEVRLDGELVGRARSASSALSLLQWDLNRLVSATSGRRLLLHASAVRLDDGGLALFPAPPNGGKSTLVAGLVRSGLGYLSDETVAVDLATVECEGYRKAVNLDRGAWPLFDLGPPPAADPDEAPAAERLVDPRRLNPAALSGGATGGAILMAFPAYRSGDATRAEPVSRSSALVALIANCVNLDGHGVAGVEALGRLAATVPAFDLSMGDLADAVALVRSLTSGARQPGR